MIVVRTNCNGTLGHLARTRHLARELAARGHGLLFLLDRAAPAMPAGWLDGVAADALYAGEEGAYRDEADDARRCLARLAGTAVSLVLVDDYRLGQRWERALGALGVPLVAIDDLAREHAAELVVAPGLERAGAPRARGPGRVIGGAEHVLLDPACVSGDEHGSGSRGTATLVASTAPDPSDAAARVSEPSDPPIASDVPRVLLSLGGGGDLAFLADIVEAVLDALAANAAGRDGPRARLQAVIGPQGKGAGRLEALAACRPDALELVRGATSLGPWLRGAALFVGAAGTAVYECAATGVPAISFAISEDQRGTVPDLERLGHFLHLDALGPTDLPAFARLVATALDALPRLRALRRAGTVRVDDRGAARVADAIESLLDAGRDGRATRGTAPTLATGDGEAVDDGKAATRRSGDVAAPRDDARDAGAFRAIRCDDRDVNRYLDARNLAANRRNMADTTPIGRLAHYRWWLTTSRESWRVGRGERDELYIWHQRVDAAGLEALIGGWFVAREDADIATVIAALRWQLARTDREAPALPWLAVIHRDNGFTWRMNRGAGFVEAVPGSIEERAIAALFPNVSREDFRFVHRPPAARAPARTNG